VQLQAENSPIVTATDLAEEFLMLLRRREGDRLPAWLDAAEHASPLSGGSPAVLVKGSLALQRVGVIAGGSSHRWSASSKMRESPDVMARFATGLVKG